MSRGRGRAVVGMELVVEESRSGVGDSLGIAGNWNRGGVRQEG